jgi:hypothetical protein
MVFSVMQRQGRIPSHRISNCRELVYREGTQSTIYTAKFNNKAVVLLAFNREGNPGRPFQENAIVQM